MKDRPDWLGLQLRLIAVVSSPGSAILKFPRRNSLRRAAPVHWQNEILELFVDGKRFQDGEKEKAVTLVTI